MHSLKIVHKEMVCICCLGALGWGTVPCSLHPPIRLCEGQGHCVRSISVSFWLSYGEEVKGHLLRVGINCPLII